MCQARGRLKIKASKPQMPTVVQKKHSRHDLDGFASESSSHCKASLLLLAFVYMRLREQCVQYISYYLQTRSGVF